MTDLQNSFLLIVLLASIICSLTAGLTSVSISKERAKTTLSLSILLLIAGIFAEVMMWSLLPLWYHLIFLILLIPITILGGKLRRAGLFTKNQL